MGKTLSQGAAMYSASVPDELAMALTPRVKHLALYSGWFNTAGSVGSATITPAASDPTIAGSGEG